MIYIQIYIRREVEMIEWHQLMFCDMKKRKQIISGSGQTISTPTPRIIHWLPCRSRVESRITEVIKHRFVVGLLTGCSGEGQPDERSPVCLGAERSSTLGLLWGPAAARGPSYILSPRRRLWMQRLPVLLTTIHMRDANISCVQVGCKLVQVCMSTFHFQHLRFEHNFHQLQLFYTITLHILLCMTCD